MAIEVKPNSTYSWNPTDKIEISGIEYSIIQKTLAMFEPALATSQAIFQRMLEQGIAKEQEGVEEAPTDVEYVPADVAVDEHVPHVD